MDETTPSGAYETRMPRTRTPPPESRTMEDLEPIVKPRAVWIAANDYKNKAAGPVTTHLHSSNPSWVMVRKHRPPGSQRKGHRSHDDYFYGMGVRGVPVMHRTTAEVKAVVDEIERLKRLEEVAVDGLTMVSMHACIVCVRHVTFVFMPRRLLRTRAAPR